MNLKKPDILSFYQTTYQWIGWVPGAAAPEISLLWQLSVGMGLLCAFMVVVVFRTKQRLGRESAFAAKKKQELAPVVSNFLFMEEDANIAEKTAYLTMKVAIREQLKDQNSRKVFAEMLLDLQRDITGTARNRLFSLYTDLGLHEFAFEKLGNWRWEIVAQGILELSHMQVKESYTYIKPLVNHRKGVIRKQAQLAIVSLQPEGINYFLDTARFGISEWQQMKLMDILGKFKDYIPPRFSLWLTSSNTDVVLFSLRLIKHYKQNEARQALLQLLGHPKKKILIATLECIREFGLEEALEPLKAKFSGYTTEVKMAVLDVFAELGSDKDIDFLLDIKNQKVNFIVKSKALSCINSISPNSILPHIPDSTSDPKLDSIAETNELEYQEINQATDSLRGNNDKTNSVDEWIYSELDEEEEVELAELCSREEWEDILFEFTEPDREVLNISFLPFIGNPKIPSDHEDEAHFNQESGQLHQIEVESTDVAEEEKFRSELESILGRIQVFDKPAEAEETLSGTADHTEEDNIAFKWDPESTNQVESVNSPVDVKEPAGDDTREDAPQGQSYRFSIFEELFRNCDTESKLILLDEIVAVGGEKELRFLASLESDGSREVREKSRKIAASLREVLENEAAVLHEAQLEHDVGTGLCANEPEGNIKIKKPLETCFLMDPEELPANPGTTFWDIPFQLEESPITTPAPGNLDTREEYLPRSYHHRNDINKIHGDGDG